MIKNLEIPVRLKLAKCYMKIEQPDPDRAIECCAKVLEKNVDSQRSKALYRRAIALLGKSNDVLEQNLAEQDLRKALEIETNLKNESSKDFDKGLWSSIVRTIKLIKANRGKDLNSMELEDD